MSDKAVLEPVAGRSAPTDGGRGRTDRVEVRVRLDRQLLARLDAVAASTGRTRSDLICESLESAWPRIDPAAIPALKRLDETVAEFHAGALASGASDMTEDQLAAFVDEEIKAYRAEKRALRAGGS